MLNVLDLPNYLSEHQNKVSDVKIICVLNRQINMPEHLKKLSNGGQNIPSLVDLVGIDIGGRKHLVKGQAVVMLGPRAYEPTNYGKRVLLLQGTAYLRDESTNYVEILMIYPRNDKVLSLYATKTLFREIPEMRNAYPDFMKQVDDLARGGWDFETFYSSFDTPFDYRISCSGCEFDNVLKSEQFVFKSEEDYKKSRVVGVAPVDDSYGDSLTNYKSEDSISDTKSKLESRNNILKLPKRFEEIEDILETANERVFLEIEKLGKYSGLVDADKDIEYLYKSIKDNWRRAPSSDSVTGRALLKGVIEHIYPEFKSRYDKGVPFIDSAIDSHKLLDIWYTGEVPMDLKDSFFYVGVSQMREVLNIAVIDYLLGLKKRLYSAYTHGKHLNKDLYSVLCTNPYYFSIIDNRLTIEDLDKLGMLYKVNLKDPEVLKFRNGAYLHNFMLDTNNAVVEENTIVERDLVLNSIYNGLVLSSKSYKTLMSTGFTFSDKILYNLRHYIKADLDTRDFMLPKAGWKEKKIRNISKYVLPLFRETSSEDVIKDYLSVGLGVEYKVENKYYLVDYIYILKEHYIIRRLYELQVNGEKPVLDNAKIEQCIRGFERLKSLEWNIPNFKLEERQADAVRLLYNPVMCLTGSAGSGKTTTAEAILYALQALLGIEEENIMFCAPTGKAANRLKEIVKKPTRTINSLFGIGDESYTILPEEKVKKKSEIKVLIVDESSMINLNLMYNMISKLSDGTRIIFLGDRSQLPPIGPGKPFTNLLTFLPCVVLNVSKRAAENSGITRNAEFLLNNSDTYYVDDLEQYDDFRILETPKIEIVKLVQGIVNYHLGRAGEKRTGKGAYRVLQSLDVNLEPDDIQVITPINKYEWGTRNLNQVLQNVFNPCIDTKKPRVRFVADYEIKTNFLGKEERVPRYVELRVGDRVIHLENMASKMRYLHIQDSVFKQIHTTSGVMNGDVGKVVGFIKGSDLIFVNDFNEKDEEAHEYFANSDNVIYIAVKYQDVDENGQPLEYIIFYKSDYDETLNDNADILRSQNMYTVMGTDLYNLDLAYALTVHKFQGSQAKLIICVMYHVGYTTFISRNMIYTAMTRAEEGIYLVGSIFGRDSAINKGRKIEQNKLRDTLTDKIFEDDVK